MDEANSGAKKSKKQKSIKLIAYVIMPILFVLFVIIFVMDFHIKNGNMIKDNTYKSLKESILHQQTILTAKLNGYFLTLGSVSVMISDKNEVETPADIIRKMNMLAGDGKFYFLGFADKDGVTVTSDGQGIYDISDRPYFKSAMQKQVSVSYIHEDRATSAPVFVLAIPCVDDSLTIGVVFGCFKTSVFSSLIVPEAYSRQSYSVICDSIGDIIISSANRPSTSTESNVIELFKNSQLQDKITIATVIEDIKNGKSNSIHYTSLKEDRYTTYMSLGINDWRIVTVVSAQYVDVQKEQVLMLVIVLLLKLLIITAIGIVFVMLAEKQQSEALKIERARYQAVEQFTKSIFFEGNYKNDTLVFNENYSRVFNLSIASTKLSKFKESLPNIYSADRPLVNDLFQNLKQSVNAQSVDVRLQEANGNYSWYRIDVKTMRDDMGKKYKMYGRISSIEDMKKEAIEFKDLSEIDALTKLLNRAAFQERVCEIIAKSTDQNVHAMVLIDIDDFKQINDTYGHMVGDDVLIGIADEMRELLRGSDLMSRLGGDEFVMFLKNVKSVENVMQVADRLCKAIENSAIKGVKTTCSVGIAMYPTSGKTFDELYKNADSALYSAKGKGKNGYSMFIK